MTICDKDVDSETQRDLWIDDGGMKTARAFFFVLVAVTEMFENIIHNVLETLITRF